jgi:hypothetical protein
MFVVYTYISDKVIQLDRVSRMTHKLVIDDG